MSGVNGSEQQRQAIKRRGLNANGGNSKTQATGSLEGGGSLGMDKMGMATTKEVKHYDADGVFSSMLVSFSDTLTSWW